MKFETFTEDPLERGDFAKGLIDFIEVEHHFVDGSLVVSLSSPYGTGASPSRFGQEIRKTIG